MERYKHIINKVFKGSIFHTPIYSEFEYIEDALILVDFDGMIKEVIKKDDSEYDKKLLYLKNNFTFIELSSSQYFLPGFVDLHVHAPQWPQAGIALDEPLNVWLDECTFPLEAKYKDLDFSRLVYDDLVENYIKRGTTTALYFATVDKHSSLELVKSCIKFGQRGLVGKVVMDNKNTCPHYYRDETTHQAIEDTEQFILEVKELSKNYKTGVYPVITPRFVPSCTDEVLAGLSTLKNKYNVHVQSHCSESDWEHHHVLERFGIRDTQVFEKYDLLGHKTVLAHCNFINEEDGEIFSKTRTSVAHCPISNSYFANSVLPVKRLKSQGVNIGLGTDISGGFSPSLYENIRHSVMASRMLEDGVDSSKDDKDRAGVENSRISVVEALYLATLGGGKALDLPVGIIKEGYICDLQVVDINDYQNRISTFDVFTSKKNILEKILYLSNSNNIVSVYIQGNEVYKK